MAGDQFTMLTLKEMQRWKVYWIRLFEGNHISCKDLDFFCSLRSQQTWYYCRDLKQTHSSAVNTRAGSRISMIQFNCKLTRPNNKVMIHQSPCIDADTKEPKWDHLNSFISLFYDYWTVSTETIWYARTRFLKLTNFRCIKASSFEQCQTMHTGYWLWTIFSCGQLIKQSITYEPVYAYRLLIRSAAHSNFDSFF